MFITLNFILLFLVIILPGIVFRRMYYFGDFSKQFRIKEPLHHLFISNIIPGVIFLILSLIILRKLEWISPIVELYPLVWKSLQGEYHLDDNFIKDIPKITGVTFLLSLLIGWISSRTIRALKLDVKYKLLRYRNNWHYLFSGEISSFSKFKSTVAIKQKMKKRKVYYPPLVDILIEDGSEKILYTGMLLDYAVSQDDLLRLERVYLNNAYRYSKREGGTVQVSIPGDLFVLATHNLINININYPEKSLFDRREEEENKEARRNIIFKIITVILGILTFLLLGVFIFSLFVDLKWLFYDSHRWYGKLLLLLISFQIISILRPERIVEENRILFFPKKALRTSVVWIVILLIIYGIIYWPF